MSTVTLIVTAGIAAYKALEIIRLLRESGHQVVPVLSKNAGQFVTPLSLEVLAEHPVCDDLFAPGQESEIGHIQRARESDLIVVAPASADFLARMALGLADDFPSTLLLANTAPVLVAPAMNHRMWLAEATQGHLATLESRGVQRIGPVFGEMACKEQGIGRMAEAFDIVCAVDNALKSHSVRHSLAGKRAVVTGGPTFEPIDPVRYLGNYSSGLQAKAIVRSLVAAGAEVCFIHGPIVDPNILGVERLAVETAEDMLAAVETRRDCDIFIAAAAVSDWRVVASSQKRKKGTGESMTLELQENPDILRTVAEGTPRARLVVGFAAETENLHRNAEAKLRRKGCDWLLANEISRQNPAFAATENHLWLYQRATGETVSFADWGCASKAHHAARLVAEIAQFFRDEQRHETT